MAARLPAVFHHPEERRHKGKADGGVGTVGARLPQAPQAGAGFRGRQPAEPPVQQQGY